jgi:hypothetical protein
LETGAEETEGAESELVENGAVSEGNAGFDCTESFAVPKDAASASELGVRAFDEGAEAFTPENRFPESCDVPDIDGDAEEAGAGDDIMCLKMLEVADDKPLLLAWVVVWGAD